jgi:hypothetical protein
MGENGRSMIKSKLRQPRRDFICSRGAFVLFYPETLNSISFQEEKT